VWKSNKYTDKLTVRVIDRDGGSIGSAVSSGLVRPISAVSDLQLTLQLAHTNLRFFPSPASAFPTDADVAHDVVQEGTWAAIVISSDATTDLQQARANGDSSYRGESAIHVYYAQARQENAVGSYLLPYMQAALGQVTAQISAQSVAE